MNKEADFKLMNPLEGNSSYFSIVARLQFAKKYYKGVTDYNGTEF